MGFVGTQLQYGANGERVDIDNESYMDKFNRITRDVENEKKILGIQEFNKSCGVSLLVLATNCEFKQPLNQEHLQNVVDECSKQFHFYNWAFCHSRNVLNEGNNTGDGDFGRPGYLDKSQRYYQLYLHLNNFDGDYDDLYTHIMEVSEYGE